jgi:hypothetical protein
MSNYTKATNFAAKDALPSGNAGKIIKGTEIDTEYNAIASAISSKADTNSPTFTGTPLTPTASSTTNNTQIASTAFVKTVVAAEISAALPAGTIVLWSGSVASIPTGWVLCNGSNSTPDLRNRFIVGAGSTYAVDATGGSADAIVVSHTHTATVTDPGHTHTLSPTNRQVYNSGASGTAGLTNGGETFTQLTMSSATTGITVANSSTGSSGTNANLPPYYALCYIMKT